MIRRIAVLLVFAAVTITLAQKPNKRTVDAGNVDYISQEQLRDYLTFIASDELEGRDTPSRGLNIAAKFIATHLSRWGYTPGGDNGSYFQKIMLNRTKVRPSATTVETGGQSFSFGTDYITTAVGATVSAPLIYVKNGYIHKGKNVDPYQGLDVSGKIMVVLGGFPKGITPADFGGKLGVDFDSPANYGKNHGALGIISIPSASALGQWERNKTAAVERGSLSVPSFKKADEKPTIPTITASAKLIDAIFAGEKTGVQSMSSRASADSVAPFLLSAAKKVSFTVAVSVETLYTQNVIGILEGSDKKIKDEYVAFGAHYDHIGIRNEPVNGDSINNGADDDGSGTVSLMAMAEAFSKGTRPKRSLMFIWHMGEEKGLWGSKYFVEHPTVPLEKIITQLNMDMIGRSRPDTGEVSKNEDYSGTNEVFSIGSNMMSSELGALNESNNASLYNLKLNYKFDDPSDPNKLFYRSDHYNYAKMGIPIVFYFDGIHEDYHRVSDEVSKIDFEKLLKVTKTIYGLGWKLSNLPKRPVVDKKFDRSLEE